MAIAGVVGGFAAWLELGIGGKTTVRTFDDVVTAVAALTAALLAARTGLGDHGPLRRFWLLLAAACGAWTVAEVIWAAYDLVLSKPVPVPSWADVGYLGAVPFAAAAVFFHPAIRLRRQHGGATAILDGAIVASALLFLSWTFVLGSAWHTSDLSTAGGIVTVAYPFSDVVLVFLAVLAVRSMSVVERVPLWCVLGGLLAMATSDSVYTYLTAAGSYSTGELVDTGWVAAYLGIALGAWLAPGREVAAAAPPPTDQTSTASLLAPIVPVLVALAAAAAEVWTGHQLEETSWLMALVLTVLVLARQGVSLVGRGWRSLGGTAGLPGARPGGVPS